MPASDQTTGFLLQDLLDPNLVLRIDGAGITGDGKSLDPSVRNHFPGDPPNFGLVDRFNLFTRDFQPAGYHCLGFMRDIALLEKPVRGHDHQSYLLTFTFDNGVGGQGGGDRHKVNLGQQRFVQTGQRLTDADGKIPFCGQRFAFTEEFAGWQIIDDGIGVGSTGIDAQADLKQRFGILAVAILDLHSLLIPGSRSRAGQYRTGFESASAGLKDAHLIRGHHQDFLSGL